jgi:RNA polymerase subunit RPABC4/transcription elongation factor Spt4
MKQFLEVLIFVIIGIALLWFGYTLFFQVGIPAWGGAFRKRKGLKPQGESMPGDPQTCPVCSAKLGAGELVSAHAFPSLNGGKDRFMHIRGCIYCLMGDRDRVCPVCGTILRENEILISRLFERPGHRSHVHVIGCSNCKGSNRCS